VKILLREELRVLVENTGKPAVSIYMPTHRAGDIGQAPIRLKNCLRQAEERLIDSGLRAAEVRQMLEPTQKLLTDVYFWRHQSDGLAVFISPVLFRYYRLPYSFQELVVVAERFHIKPLLPLFSEYGLFYLLALSQNQVRLLQCTRTSTRMVTPESVPRSLAEALKYDEPQKKQQQMHTAGTGPAIRHGQGVGKELDKVSILRYFQSVDRGLHELLREESTPLVIAAVDYLHAIYRQANTYGRLLDQGIEGNPDRLSDEELQERAWTIMQPYFERGRAEAVRRYSQIIGTGMASNDIEQVVLAAYDGRVSELFVALSVQKWGQIDLEQRAVRLYEERKQGEDVLDFAAEHALIRGGTVYAVEPDQVPGKGPVAAILRY